MGRDKYTFFETFTVMQTKNDSDVLVFFQLLSKKKLAHSIWANVNR